MNDLIELTIVIPTHARPCHVRELLASICEQRFSFASLEVLVVANFADPETSQSAQEFAKLLPHLSFHEANVLGVNVSRNIGLERARGEIVLFLDDDCRLISPFFLSRLVELHKRFPEVLAIGGSYVSSPASTAVEAAYGRIANAWMNPPTAGMAFSWRLVGGNVSYKAKLLTPHRFNPDILFGGAETELHRRLELNGMIAILHADLPVLHLCHVSIGQLIKKGLSQGMSAERYGYPATTRAGSPTETPGKAAQPPEPEPAWAHRIYTTAFAAGSVYAKQTLTPVGRFDLRMYGLFFLFAIAELIFPKVLTKSIFWIGYRAVTFLIGKMRAVSVSAFWLVRQKISFVWWRGYSAACQIAGQLRAVGVKAYWGTFQITMTIFQTATQFYWFLFRITMVTKAKLVQIYWLVFGFTALVRSFALYIYWRLYCLKHRSLGALRAFSIKSYWRLYAFVSSLRLASKNLYWWCHNKRCRFIGWMVQTYWRVYSWHWRFRGPIQGVRTRIHGRWRAVGFGFKFVQFYFANLKLQGSRTSRFLHLLWAQRSPPHEIPSVFIPPETNIDQVAEFARLASVFGIWRLAFDEAPMVNPDLTRECLRLRVAGFEIDIYYRPHFRTTAHLERMNQLQESGCLLTPYLDRRDLETQDFDGLNDIGPVNLALSTDIQPEDFPAIQTLSSKLQHPKIEYVDLFDRNSFKAKSVYDLACHVALNKQVAGPWRVRQIFQPFHGHRLSRQRLLEGQIKWQNRPTSAGEPKWSIVIPCYQHFEFLPLVIDHILSQIYAVEQIEIIAVDDGSRPPVHETVAIDRFETAAANIKLVRIERQACTTEPHDSTFRAGVARNAGILHAKGARVLFLDSDILMPSNHLRQLDQAFENGADVVQSVRHMLTAEFSSASTKADLVDHRLHTYAEDSYWESFKQVQDWNTQSAPWKYVCTYALALSRKCIDHVKIFRPEFCEYGFEDTEMGFRLFRMGYRFHLLKSPVFHLYPAHDRSRELHFDENERFRALCQTAQLFYRMHCDPSIYFELRSFMGASVANLNESAVNRRFANDDKPAEL